MKGSQNQVVMNLRVIGQNVHVINFPKEEKTPKINPVFANRANCSKEGENLKITLHRLQESDSEIYQCSEIVEVNDRPKHLYGKKTIVVVKGFAIPPLNKGKYRSTFEIKDWKKTQRVGESDRTSVSAQVMYRFEGMCGFAP